MLAITPQFAAHAANLLHGIGGHSLVPHLLDAYGEFDHFSAFDADDDYVVTNATAGTAEVIDGIGGLLQLDAASSTADQGVQVQRKIETFLPAAGKDILFECQLKITDTIDKAQFFAGLAVLDTTLIGSGEMSASDYIGFLGDATKMAGADAGELDLELKKTGQTAEASSSAAAPAEDTYLRLGFLLRGITSITPLVDGVAGAVLSITNCPVTEMAASWVCQSEGTNDPIVTLDWYYCLQLR